MNNTISLILLLLTGVTIVVMTFLKPGDYLPVYLSAVGGFLISLVLLLRARRKRR